MKKSNTYYSRNLSAFGRMPRWTLMCTHHTSCRLGDSEHTPLASGGTVVRHRNHSKTLSPLVSCDSPMSWFILEETHRSI